MEPEVIGYALVLALRSPFEQAGTTPSDIGTIELNEAFAAQAVAVIRDTRLDPERTNPYGGAIALGHPVGATGAILTLRVAQDLVRRDLELGIVTNVHRRRAGAGRAVPQDSPISAVVQPAGRPGAFAARAV